MNHFMNNGIEYLRKPRKRSLLYYDEIDVKKIDFNAIKDIQNRGEKLEDYMYQSDTNLYSPAVRKSDYHDYCNKRGIEIEQKYL